VDRLPLFKALGDRTRYAIYVEVANSGVPLTTTAIADRLELHPNTIRLHLERLREVGLLEMSTHSHGGVGRPQHCWSLSLQAPALGLEPSGFRLLAHLLAEVAAQAPLDDERLAGIGRARGRDRVAKTGPATSSATVHSLAAPLSQSVPAQAAAVPGAAAAQPDPPAEVPAGEPSTGANHVCLGAFVDALADLGFDPVVEPDGALTSVAFTKCPFRELATAYPDMVCQLHRGVTDGILQGARQRIPGASLKIRAFSTLLDQDPCRVELSEQ
jgi:predicted ArsR family transcriptional regulator